MRHCKIGRHLNRNSSHRRSMFRNMSISLIKYEVIKTTLAKAKELRRFIEPIITISKKDNIANRRLIFSKIRDKDTVLKLFNDICKRYIKRNGGYTRVLKCGFRTGDNAKVAYIMLVEHKKDIVINN